MSGRIFDYRVIAYSASICPCKEDCPNRNEECHGKCEDYLEYKRKMEIIKAENKKCRRNEADLDSFKDSNICKRTGKKRGQF